MRFVYLIFAFIFVLALVHSCSNKKYLKPVPAVQDKALLDSCKNNSAFYFYKGKDSIYSGAHGPHGTFKLKFNSVAKLLLTDNGKIPVGSVFPENSMIVKEAVVGGSVHYYALMYKFHGSWLWAEIKPDGTVMHSVESDPKVCISCHTQTGHRDLVDSFIFY